MSGNIKIFHICSLRVRAVETLMQLRLDRLSRKTKETPEVDCETMTLLCPLPAVVWLLLKDGIVLCS